MLGLPLICLQLTRFSPQAASNTNRVEFKRRLVVQKDTKCAINDMPMTVECCLTASAESHQNAFRIWQMTS